MPSTTYAAFPEDEQEISKHVEALILNKYYPYNFISKHGKFVFIN
jgi:hypothetical protein